MHTSKGTQEVAKPRPDTFHRVAVDLTESIAVVVTGMLMVRVTYRHVASAGVRDMVVGGTLIGVQ